MDIDKKEIIDALYKNFNNSNSVLKGACFIMPDGRFVQTNFHADLEEWLMNYFKLDIDVDEPIEPVEYFNAVRVNDGNAYFFGDFYMELPPKKLTAMQFDSVENWLDDISSFDKIGISVFGTRKYQIYDLSQSSSYIINRIKKYYNTGELKESMQPLKEELIGRGWSYDQLKAEIKRRRPGYTLDRLERSRNKEQVAFRELNRIVDQDNQRNSRKEAAYQQNLSKSKADFENAKNSLRYDNESGYWKIGDMEFVSDTEAWEYLDDMMNESLDDLDNIMVYHADEYLEKVFTGWGDDTAFDKTLRLLKKVEKQLEIPEEELIICITEDYVEYEDNSEEIDTVEVKLDRENSYIVSIRQVNDSNIIFGIENFNGITQMYFRNEEEAEEFLKPVEELKEAKKSKKSKIHINPNAGDPQKGVAIFNNMNNIGGLCEDLHPVPEDFTINTLKSFDKEAKKLKLTDDDIQELKEEMKKRAPKADLGSYLYKFEWWPKRFNLGRKEGRVIYAEYISDSMVWLASIYQKKNKSDLTPKEQDNIKAIVKLQKTNTSRDV